MGIKQLYNYNLRNLPNEYGDVSVMFFQFYYKVLGKNKGSIFFNQFVKSLFCILYCCILGQTETNDYLIFLLRK